MKVWTFVMLRNPGYTPPFSFLDALYYTLFFSCPTPLTKGHFVMAPTVLSTQFDRRFRLLIV
jgi:hypothetical protein